MMLDIAMWLVGLVVYVLLAAATAAYAESKGESPPIWFLLSLIAPVLTLLVLALLVRRPEGARPVQPHQQVLEAAGLRVGGHLDVQPRSIGDLAEKTGLEEDAVRQQLGQLRRAGLAYPVAEGRWVLSELGAELRSGQSGFRGDR